MQKLQTRMILQPVPLAGLAASVFVVLSALAYAQPDLLTLALLTSACLLIAWIAVATLITRFYGVSTLAAELPLAMDEFHALTRFSALVNLENWGRRPALLLRVELLTAAGGHSLPSPPVFLGRLDAKTCTPCRWLVTARMRGRFELTAVRARACFPGSLIGHEARLPLHRSLLVLPAIYRLTPRIFNLLQGRRLATARLHALPASVEEFAGVRLYRPGDNPRQIHPGLSSRLPGYPVDLVLREYENPVSEDICLVLDNALSAAEASDLAFRYRREKALSFAVAFSQMLCERKYRLRFVTCDERGRLLSLSIDQPARDLPRLRTLAARLEPCIAASPLSGYLRREARWGNALLILLSLRESVAAPPAVIVFSPDNQTALVEEVEAA